MDDFIQKFADIFDDTDPDEITPDTEFKNLDEWGSLMSLALIAMARTEYGKPLTGMEIKDCTTVRELYDLLNSK